MYINFKCKYKKIFWLLFGFLLACVFTSKVYASASFETYDFNNYTLTYNGYTYNKANLLEIISTKLATKNRTIDDYPYLFISIPTNPTTQSGQVNDHITIYLSKKSPYSASPASSYSTWYYRYNSSDLPFEVAYISISFSNNYSSIVVGNINSNLSTVPFVYSGASSSATMQVFSNFDLSTIPIESASNYNIYTKFYYDSNLMSSAPPLPSYLQGYKKVTLTTDDKYVMLSGLSSGSVFIPTQQFQQYGGRLSYYDNDLDSQPYTSYIQDYTTMSDDEYVKQDFDLSQYYGADWVMFSKYIYLEGEDDISYDIYVPNDIYDSLVTVTPNSSGGNDFDFEYKDSNGIIQSDSVQSSGLSQDSPLLGNIFSDFTNDDFGLASIITAPLPLIQSLGTATCTPLNLPLSGFTGRHDQTLTLPCMTPLYQSWFGDLFILYQTITTGFIAYWVGIAFFNQIKQLKDPDYDKIEVINL